MQPFRIQDTGADLFAGRNRLVDRVATPHFLLCEDDFEFTDKTRVADMLAVVKRDPEIAMCGGVVENDKQTSSWAVDFDVFGATERFDAEQARRVIAELPEPCVLKDPRFHFTLTRWLPVLAEYQPALV